MRNAQVHSTETETFEKRLRAYAVGAGAVAAGLLAFSPPAAAEIVVTETHVTLVGNSGPFLIDIEGTTEFTLKIKGQGDYYNRLNVVAVYGAGVVGHGHSNQVAALKFGAPIGTTDQFEARTQLLASACTSRLGGCQGIIGPFANVTNRFLGLKFELNGQVCYGWAGFSKVIAGYNSVTAVLTAYAYETEPNTPIYAGQSSDSPRESRLLPANGNTAKLQPATLGVLALGSLGLDVWRKRETGVQEVS